MHESGVLQTVMRRAGDAAERSGGRLSEVRLRLGASCGISIEAAAVHAEAIALGWWGYAPFLDIEQSSDPAEPGALGVALVSITVEE
jgi:Zn finger protein HypA/HybF involved in hydrogenase expression